MLLVKKNLKFIAYIASVFFVIMFTFFCFYKLDSINLDDTDEARHGANGYEMVRSGDYLVSTYGEEIDYYNSKPPLSYWCIALSYKIFGFSVFSTRIYSAISLWLMVMLCGWYAYKKYGIIASCALLGFSCACSPYYIVHFGRHGDADALFVLLFVGAILCMLELERYPKLLYVCGLCFSFAFLAKSWHAIALAVIGFLYLVLTKIIKNYNIKQLGLFFISAIGPLGIWAVLRFFRDGFTFFGYMFFNDVVARSANTWMGDSGIMSYVDYLLSKQRWIWCIVPLIILMVGYQWLREEKQALFSNETIGYLLWIFVPIMLFSIPKTKIFWYIFPVIPGIVLLGAKCVGKLFDETQINFNKKVVVMVLPVLFVAINIWLNYRIINEPNINTFQQMMWHNFTREEVLESRALYRQIADGNVNWTQGDFLTAELSGDFYPLNGGIESFLEKEHGNLLVADTIYQAVEHLFENMQVRQLEDYYFVSK